MSLELVIGVEISWWRYRKVESELPEAIEQGEALKQTNIDQSGHPVNELPVCIEALKPR